MKPLRAVDMDWGAPQPIPGDSLTEATAAERFAHQHGGDVRYDHCRKRWLTWQGHRWTPDLDAAVTRLALTFARDLQQQCMAIVDREKREATFKWAIRLEKRDVLMSMLAFAKDFKPISDAGTDFDTDAWALAAPNGVVELRTATLRDGQRSDQITMSAAVPYDPGAPCPRWERTIAEVFAGNAEIIAYNQKALGYSLTGITSEQVAFIDHGGGSNGKGTIRNIVREVLGDYGHTIQFSALEFTGAHTVPTEIAALVGKRYVVASETNDGRRLDEARIKSLTGCDPVRARFLYADSFEFQPVAKFWLQVNHLPRVADDSFAFWRRVRLIPFTQTFPVNPSLADALRAEAPGILAWCIRGCLRWQAEGLNAPADVVRATETYRADSDVIGDFLREACQVDPQAEVGASDLYQHYLTWADRHHLSDRERLTATMFGKKLAERYAREKTRDGMVYVGISRRV